MNTTPQQDKTTPQAVPAQGTAPKAKTEKPAPKVAAPKAKAPNATERAVAMVLTNCTDAPRGITLKTGVVLLQPREIRTVPLAEQDEIRALFRCKTFQRFVDNGIFRLSGMNDDEESTKVPTPEAPAALKEGVNVDGLQAPVNLSTPPKVVEYQQGGSLPEAPPAKA